MTQLSIDVIAKVDDARAQLSKLNETVGDIGDTAKRMESRLEGASDATSGLKTGTINLSAALSAATDGFNLAQQAVGYLQQGYDATIAKAAAWGDSMGDLAQLTGQSVEETSRLAATMELVGVDAESLGRIVKSMTKQGLNLNLETLLKLNKQYNAIQDPVERNAFLFKNFGKAAEDMAEIMGRSEAELRKLTEAADKSGKVIGEEAAARAEKWNVQMDILGQKAEGAGIAIGNYLIDGTVNFLHAVDDATEGTLGWVRNIPLIGSALGGIRDETESFVNDMLGVGQQAEDTGEIVETSTVRATDAWTERWRGVADEALAAKAMYDTKIAALDLKGSLDVLDAGLRGDLSKAQQEFYDNQKDVAEVIAETKDKIAELESKKYLTDEQKTQLDELKTKLAEQQDVLEANRQKWTETTNSIIFDMIRQAYAADGQLSQPEIASLTELGLALGRYDQKTADVMTSVQNAIVTSGTISREELQRILDKYGYFNSLPNIEKTVTMKYQKIGDENFGGWTPPATPSGGGSTTTTDNTQLTGVQGGYASGGSFVVPGSGSGDRPYVVNLTPGERVDVTPVGKSSSGGGGSPIVGQIVINQQPGQDAEDLARVVQRHIAKWARQKAGTGNW